MQLLCSKRLEKVPDTYFDELLLLEMAQLKEI